MNKKNNKIIIPLLVLVAFIGGSVWTYLVINQLNRGTTNSVTKGGNYTINENSISGAVDKIYDATVTVATYKDGKVVSPNFILSVFPNVATCFILAALTVNTAISEYVSPPKI